MQIPAELRSAAGPFRSHDDLPLPEFDHMTLGSLRGRLRRLDGVSLVQLLDYEQAHAARLPIISMLQNRLRRVIEDGEPPAPHRRRRPPTCRPRRRRWPSRRRRPPPQNPPSQGDPTNPTQPRG